MSIQATRHSKQTQLVSSLSHNELESLFSSLSTGALPAGDLKGRLFAIKGLRALPKPFAQMIYQLLATPLNPWRGKQFQCAPQQNHGSNLWLTLKRRAIAGQRRFGHYQVSKQVGPDGGKSFWLDYDLEKNPPLLRGIRGECRQLQNGIWLCRMLWQPQDGQSTTLLWFTLSNGQQESAYQPDPEARHEA